MSIPTVTTVPGHAFLLDVRESDEWAAGHAPGATHIPLSQLPSRVGELPADRQVVALCRSGGRSARATAFLRERGIDAHNYEGGMHAWAAVGHPMESSTGAAPAVR